MPNLLKLRDCNLKRFTGPEMDFGTWVKDFNTAIVMCGHTPEQAATLLPLWMEGDCRQVAQDFLAEYAEDHDVPTTSGAAGNTARLQYHQARVDALIAHLRTNTTITGTAPEMRLMDNWRGLAQSRGETAQTFHNRVKALVRRLKDQDPPIRICAEDQYMTFVNGLLPAIRVHVKSQPPTDKTSDTALVAAEAYESAHAQDSRTVSKPEPASRTDPWAPVVRRTYDTRQVEPSHRAPRARSASLPPDAEGSRRSRKRANTRGAREHTGVFAAGPTSAGPSRAGGMPDRRPTDPPRRAEPGSNPQICLTYLRHQRCRYGETCFRLHVLSLNQVEDVRPSVKTRVTDEMREQARKVMADYPQGPARTPPDGRRGERVYAVEGSTSSPPRIFHVRPTAPEYCPTCPTPSVLAVRPRIPLEYEVPPGHSEAQRTADLRPGERVGGIPVDRCVAAALRVLTRATSSPWPGPRDNEPPRGLVPFRGQFEFEGGTYVYHIFEQSTTSYYAHVARQPPAHTARAPSSHHRGHLTQMPSLSEWSREPPTLLSLKQLVHRRRQEARRRRIARQPPDDRSPPDSSWAGRIFTIDLRHRHRPRGHGRASGSPVPDSLHPDQGDTRKVLYYYVEHSPDGPLCLDEPQVAVTMFDRRFSLPLVFWMPEALSHHRVWIRAFYAATHGVRLHEMRQRRDHTKHEDTLHAQSDRLPTVRHANGEHSLSAASLEEEEVIHAVRRARSAAKPRKAERTLSPQLFEDEMVTVDNTGTEWITHFRAFPIAGTASRLRLVCTERPINCDTSIENFMTWSITAPQSVLYEDDGVRKAFQRALQESQRDRSWTTPDPVQSGSPTQEAVAVEPRRTRIQEADRKQGSAFEELPTTPSLAAGGDHHDDISSGKDVAPVTPPRARRRRLPSSRGCEYPTRRSGWSSPPARRLCEIEECHLEAPASVRPIRARDSSRAFSVNTVRDVLQLQDSGVLAFRALEENIADHPTPMIEVHLGSTPILALVDTGARSSLISGSLYQYLEALADASAGLILEPLHEVKGGLVGANNLPLEILGQCVLRVGLTAHCAINIWFVVVAGLSAEMILGDHTLGPSKLGAVIDLVEWKIHFKTLDLTVPLAHSLKAAEASCSLIRALCSSLADMGRTTDEEPAPELRLETEHPMEVGNTAEEDAAQPCVPSYPYATGVSHELQYLREAIAEHEANSPTLFHLRVALELLEAAGEAHERCWACQDPMSAYEGHPRTCSCESLREAANEACRVARRVKHARWDALCLDCEFMWRPVVFPVYSLVGVPRDTTRLPWAERLAAVSTGATVLLHFEDSSRVQPNERCIPFDAAKLHQRATGKPEEMTAVRSATDPTQLDNPMANRPLANTREDRAFRRRVLNELRAQEVAAARLPGVHMVRPLGPHNHEPVRACGTAAYTPTPRELEYAKSLLRPAARNEPAQSFDIEDGFVDIEDGFDLLFRSDTWIRAAMWHRWSKSPTSGPEVEYLPGPITQEIVLVYVIDDYDNLLVLQGEDARVMPPYTRRRQRMLGQPGEAENRDVAAVFAVLGDTGQRLPTSARFRHVRSSVMTEPVDSRSPHDPRGFRDLALTELVTEVTETRDLTGTGRFPGDRNWAGPPPPTYPAYRWIPLSQCERWTWEWEDMPGRIEAARQVLISESIGYAVEAEGPGPVAAAALGSILTITPAVAPSSGDGVKPTSDQAGGVLEALAALREQLNPLDEAATALAGKTVEYTDVKRLRRLAEEAIGQLQTAADALENQFWIPPPGRGHDEAACWEPLGSASPDADDTSLEATCGDGESAALGGTAGAYDVETEEFEELPVPDPPALHRSGGSTSPVVPPVIETPPASPRPVAPPPLKRRATSPRLPRTGSEGGRPASIKYPRSLGSSRAPDAANSSAGTEPVVLSVTWRNPVAENLGPLQDRVPTPWPTVDPASGAEAATTRDRRTNSLPAPTVPSRFIRSLSELTGASEPNDEAPENEEDNETTESDEDFWAQVERCEGHLAAQQAHRRAKKYAKTGVCLVRARKIGDSHGQTERTELHGLSWQDLKQRCLRARIQPNARRAAMITSLEALARMQKESPNTRSCPPPGELPGTPPRGIGRVFATKDDDLEYRDVPLLPGANWDPIPAPLTTYLMALREPEADPPKIDANPESATSRDHLLYEDPNCIPVVILYAGIGGVSLGIPQGKHPRHPIPEVRRRYFLTALAVEGEAAICMAHRLTHPHIPCEWYLMRDVEQTLRLIEKFLPQRHWSKAWVHASPSCRQASAINLNRDEDDAAHDTEFAVEVMRRMRPACWTLEQAPNLYFRFRGLHPFVRQMKMHEFCRLPQERMRLIMSSHLLRFHWSADPTLTVREALETYKDWPPRAVVYMMNSFGSVRTIDAPAFTITGGSHQLGASQPDGFGPEYQMTWQERALIQGVDQPAKLRFPPKSTEKFRRQLVANMVPPPFAVEMALAVLDAMFAVPTIQTLHIPANPALESEDTPLSQPVAAHSKVPLAPSPSAVAVGWLLQRVTVEPFGVLGTQLDQPHRVQRAPLPAECTNPAVVIVDPAGLPHIRTGPRGARGAAGEIYQYLGIAADSEFPAEVRAHILNEGHACYHCYRASDRMTEQGGTQCHVIHVASPDFAKSAPSTAEAIERLAAAYASILQEFLRLIGQEGSPERTSPTTLRLPPLAGGLYAGCHRSRIPRLTHIALAQAFEAMTPDAQRRLLQEEDALRIHLCIFKKGDYAAYCRAFTQTSSTQRALPVQTAPENSERIRKEEPATVAVQNQLPASDVAMDETPENMHEQNLTEIENELECSEEIDWDEMEPIEKEASSTPAAQPDVTGDAPTAAVKRATSEESPPAAKAPRTEEPDVSSTQVPPEPPAYKDTRQRWEDELPVPDPLAPALDQATFTGLMDISEDLTAEQAAELRSLLWEYRAVLSPPPRLGMAKIPPHEIITEGRPISQAPYKVGPEKQKVIEESVNTLLEQGCIEPSMSAWASPVVLVKKPNGSWRFCCDYRKLNLSTARDSYPLPRIDTTLHMLGGKRYFSSLDLLSGFWQIPLTEESKQKTAFVTAHGLWQWRVMPMGPRNSPATFQRAMDTVLAGLKWSKCLIYIDDILIYGATWEEHLANLRSVLDRLEKCCLYVKPDKCSFARSSTTHLGHEVSAEGLKPLEKHVVAVREFPTPRTKTQLQSFLGLSNYYRTFIANYARIAAPLYQLLPKDIPSNIVPHWGETQQLAMESLKQQLSSAPILAYPDWDQAFTLRTDASIEGLGAVLMQEGKTIAYLSRSLSAAEKKYDTRELECLAVIYACENLKPYLQNNKAFVVQTDHANLKWLMGVRHDSGRLARWALRLSEFDMHLEHISGTKNSVADCLSRNPVDVATVRPHQCAGPPIPPKWRPLVCVSHEYDLGSCAVSVPVRWVSHITEPIPTRKDLARMQADDEFCAPIIRDLQSADASGGGGEGIEVEHHAVEEVEDEAEDEVAPMPECTAGEENDGGSAETPMTPGTVLEGDQHLRPRFQLRNGLLVYFDPKHADNFRVVVPMVLRRTVLLNVHNSAISGHVGRDRTLARLQLDYYWPRMNRDARKWVKTCTECQKAKSTRPDNKGYLVPRALTTKPFEVISMDLLGPFPLSYCGNRYCLTIIDSFSNFPILVPVPNKESTSVAEALFRHVVLEHGCFECLLSDREPTLAADAVGRLIALIRARRTYTSAYHPQCNGQCERIHRFINAALKIYMDHWATDREWPIALKCAEWAYRTSALKGSTFSPFYILYGRNPNFPHDLLFGDPHIRIPVHDYVAHTQRVLCQTHERLGAIHEQLRANQKKAYDKRRNPDEFEVGDYVLVYYPPEKCAKLCYQWRGPFAIAEKHSPVSYRLKSLITGQMDSARTNINRMARYHPRHDALLPARIEKEKGKEDERRDEESARPNCSLPKNTETQPTPMELDDLTQPPMPMEVDQSPSAKPHGSGGSKNWDNTPDPNPGEPERQAQHEVSDTAVGPDDEISIGPLSLDGELIKTWNHAPWSAAHRVEANVVLAQPLGMMDDREENVVLNNASAVRDKAVLVTRGSATFYTKARMAAQKGAAAVIIINTSDAPHHVTELGHEGDEILHIPVLMISHQEFKEILSRWTVPEVGPRLLLTVTGNQPEREEPIVESPGELPVHELTPGDFIIVQLRAEDYDQPLRSGTSRTTATKACKHGAKKKGMAREDAQRHWRLAEILDVIEENPPEPLRLQVRYWETYDTRKDLRDRVYAPAYWNSRDQEEYTMRWRKKGTPKSWEEMRDVVRATQTLVPRSFQLEADYKLPVAICQELIPFLSIHVCALPLRPETQGDPQGIFGSPDDISLHLTNG